MPNYTVLFMAFLRQGPAYLVAKPSSESLYSPTKSSRHPPLNDCELVSSFKSTDSYILCIVGFTAGSGAVLFRLVCEPAGKPLNIPVSSN